MDSFRETRNTQENTIWPHEGFKWMCSMLCNVFQCFSNISRWLPGHIQVIRVRSICSSCTNRIWIRYQRQWRKSCPAKAHCIPNVSQVPAMSGLSETMRQGSVIQRGTIGTGAVLLAGSGWFLDGLPSQFWYILRNFAGPFYPPVNEHRPWQGSNDFIVST